MKNSKSFLTREMKQIQNTILEKTGVWLKPYYAAQAFTRSSYSKQSGGQNNEALEFLGDSIIGFYVVKAIDQYYGTLKDNREDEYDGYLGYAFPMRVGQLAELKNSIVSNENLARIMDEWDLVQFLVVGTSDYNNDVDKQTKIKADLLEAIIGIIAVQCKWDPSILESVIAKVFPFKEYFKDYSSNLWQPEEYNLENAVSKLKELFEHEMCEKPVYEFTGPDKIGYDENGSPRWMCSCTVTGWGIGKLVMANSKSTAKQCAAYLNLIEKYNLANLYGPKSNAPFWEKDETGLHPDASVEMPYFEKGHKMSK